jgi:hypothetical protein
MTLRSTGCLILALAGADLARAQTVREQVAVEVITVRLTARDFFGRRLEDLKASDLALTVDGKAVAIETFSGPEPPPATRATAAAPGAAGRDAATDVPTSSPAVLEDPPLRTMIVVDEVETHLFDRKDVCAELARYLRAPAAANREFRVASFDGRLRMETAGHATSRASLP